MLLGWLATIVPLLFVATLVGGWLRARRRRRAALAALGELGAVVHREVKEGRTRVELAEVAVARAGVVIAVQLRGSQILLQSPQLARATADHGLARLPILVLRREGAIDRLAKRIGLNREVQSGDPDFDRRVYIESDAVTDDVAEVVRQPALRDAALALFDRGVTTIETIRDATPLQAAFPAHGAVLAGDGLSAAIDDFVAFARAFPAVREPMPPASARGQHLALLSFFIGFALAYAAALAASWYPVVGGALLGPTLVVGAAVWLAVSLAALRWLRGRPRTLRYLGWTSLTWLVNGPLLAAALLPVINGAGAQEVQRRTTTVEGQEVRNPNKSPSFFLTVAPWPPHRESLRLRVNLEILGLTEVGAPVVVLTSPGRLGYEWYRDVERP